MSELFNFLKDVMQPPQMVNKCYYCGQDITNKNYEVEVPVVEDGEGNVIHTYWHRGCVGEGVDKEWIEENLV